jgi:radical SAM protein with 4Fe4S-binding SPASM domain
MIKFRYESFGGIVSSTRPSFLAYINHDLAVLLGNKKSSLWQSETRYLTAPTEVHFALTNRCTVGCSHCYMDSKEECEPDSSLEDVKKMIDILAEKSVFHIALGGGEAFLRDDLFEIAHYARKVGIVPNVTTSGHLINESNAKECRVFGQINVSIDAPLDDDTPRGIGSGLKAVEAARLLRKNRVRVGINTVLSRKSFPALEELFALAKREKTAEIEVLRFKPSGRGKGIYHEMRCSDEQNRMLYPELLRLARKYRMTTKIDCSMMPMICFHEPDKKKLQKFSAVGCEAGNILLGASPGGVLSPCSFAPPSESTIGSLDFAWDSDPVFKKYREWIDNAPMPCRECDYLDLCRGGCHPLAEFETGDFYHGDPGCPWVVEYTNGK